MPDKKFHNNIDFQQHEVRSVVLEKLAAAPGAPVEAQFYYNTVNKHMYVYNGASWVFPGATDLDSLSDTDFSGFVAGTDDQYLIYDQASGTWIPGTIELNLDDCADVNFPIGLANGQALVYNSVTGKWENTVISGAGGLGINNAGVERLVLSGASAVANLEAQATITFNSANEIFDIGATAISKPVYLSLSLKSDVGAAIPAGNPIAIFGGLGYNLAASAPNAGIRITAGENHSPTLPNGNGTVLEFISTINNGVAPVSQMHISRTGCVVVNPSAYSDDHAKSDFYNKGGVANIVRTVKNLNVTIDAAGYDNKVTLFVDDLAAKSVTLPDPTVDYLGREIEIFVFASNAENVTLVTAGALTRIWYNGSATASVLTTAYGRTWRVICLDIDGTYHWMVNDHS